jgi:hypothetical protein
VPLILGCKRTDLLAAALVVVCVAVKGKGCSIIEKREFCIGVHDDDELADSRLCCRCWCGGWTDSHSHSHPVRPVPAAISPPFSTSSLLPAGCGRRVPCTMCY